MGADCTSWWGLQVSGLMLASHTSIRHLFSKCISQYEKLRKKQAFLDNYRKFPMFAVSLKLIFKLFKLALL
jgi:hypothetical protein